jgi:hypothetical protein
LLVSTANHAALLKVVLADGRSKSFTRAELDAMPLERVPAQLREGAPFEVSGVSVTALLKASGLDLSANLGGGQVVGHAPLMLSWANADGSPLGAKVGPLQLISTGESRPGRWVRQLQSLEVKSLP